MQLAFTCPSSVSLTLLLVLLLSSTWAEQAIKSDPQSTANPNKPSSSLTESSSSNVSAEPTIKPPTSTKETVQESSSKSKKVEQPSLSLAPVSSQDEAQVTVDSGRTQTSTSGTNDLTSNTPNQAKHRAPEVTKDRDSSKSLEDNLEFIKVVFRIDDDGELDEGHVSVDSKSVTGQGTTSDKKLTADQGQSEEEAKLQIDLTNHVKYMTQSLLKSLSKTPQESESEPKELNDFEHLEPKPIKSELEPDEGLTEEQLELHNQFRKAALAADYSTLFKMADDGHVKSQNHILNAYLFGKIPFNLNMLVQQVLKYSSQGNAMANMVSILLNRPLYQCWNN
jgi:hypothetical protein